MTSTPDKRILCLTSYYLPGFKSGGPLRSLLHMQEWLRGEFEFVVVTRDRDLRDAEPYAGHTRGAWNSVAGTRVWYLPPPHWWPPEIARVIRESRPDLLYLQGCFDPALTIVPLLLRRLHRVSGELPVLLAPRGQFSAGARAIKHVKKDAFLAVAKTLRLYDRIMWHATKPEEAEEIRAIWGDHVRIFVAPNLSSRPAPGVELQRRRKRPATLRLAFLSRIARMKNLLGALEILRTVRSRIEFDIYGTREDPSYWEQCSRLIQAMPGHIKIRFEGGVLPENVIPTLSNYDAFFLPTLGENFGHVILEALVAGCPVLISDQTPWRNLCGARAGFDLPLQEPQQFRQAIETLAEMDESEFSTWSAGARRYALLYSSRPEHVEATRKMLVSAMAPMQKEVH